MLQLSQDSVLYADLHAELWSHLSLLDNYQPALVTQIIRIPTLK